MPNRPRRCSQSTSGRDLRRGIQDRRSLPSGQPVRAVGCQALNSLGDLRIAGKPLLRDWDETPDYARMYHVRVMAGRIAEFLQLIEPEGKTVLPTLDDLAAHFDDPVYADLVAEVRDARDELRGALDAELPTARTSLRREVGRLRNQAFHYSYKQGADVALRRAMVAAADLPGIYRVMPGAHRALYADEIANQVMHPHSGSDETQMARIEELHQAVGNLLGPIASLVMNVERLGLPARTDPLPRILRDVVYVIDRYHRGRR